MESGECFRCRAELDHCHGTLVRHETGDVECTQACANLDEARHALTIACHEIDRGCGCVVVAGDLARAS